jgi:hypothetical protein
MRVRTGAGGGAGGGAGAAGAAGVATAAATEQQLVLLGWYSNSIVIEHMLALMHHGVVLIPSSNNDI